MRHTKGNWLVRGSYIFSDLRDDNIHIATAMSSNLDNSPSVMERDANARLMAMAPRMYNALILAKREIESIITYKITADELKANKLYEYIVETLKMLEDD